MPELFEEGSYAVYGDFNGVSYRSSYRPASSRSRRLSLIFYESSGWSFGPGRVTSV